jgi:hypothetical protein
MDRATLVTETAARLSAIRSADTIALNSQVDAAANGFLAEAAVSDEAVARQELARAFADVCTNSKLSMRIKTRILHP